MSPMLESFTAGIPSLRDLMPSDLGWSACNNNNKNKVHNKCNELESSRNHPFPSVGKLSSMKWVPAARKIGDHCSIATKFMWRVLSFPTVVLRRAQLCCLNSVLSAVVILQEVYWPISHRCMWRLAPPSRTLVLQGGGTQWVLHLIREIIRGRVSNMPKRLTHFQGFFHELL